MDAFHHRSARRRRQDGFTLIELLVVIAILSVLAAIVIFNVTGVKGNANSAACRSDVNSVQGAVDSYVSDTGSVGTSRLDGLINGSPSGSSWVFPGPKSSFWTSTVPVAGKTYALVGATGVDASYLQEAPNLPAECTTPATLTWTDGTDSLKGYTVSGS